jgi:transcriptional regulator with XRE-family HTH domain
MRERDGLTQEELAEKVGMNQNAIHRLENPNYGKPTITTLKRIAAAFDVALIVRFVPYSQLVDWVSGKPHLDQGLRPSALAVPRYADEEKERHLRENAVNYAQIFTTAVTAAEPAFGINVDMFANVTYGEDYIGKVGNVSYQTSASAYADIALKGLEAKQTFLLRDLLGSNFLTESKSLKSQMTQNLAPSFDFGQKDTNPVPRRALQFGYKQPPAATQLAS